MAEPEARGGARGAAAEPEAAAAAEPEAPAEPEAVAEPSRPPRPTRSPRRRADAERAAGRGRRGGLSPRPPARVPFVGLTGGLGAGKSTALAALARLGAATISADAVVHELYGSDEVRDAVTDAGAPEVAPGRRRRPRRGGPPGLRRPDERAWLEGLLWPLVGARVAAWRAALDGADPPPRAAVVETPLLFEAGLEGGYDATIAVVADEDVRAERAAARGHQASTSGPPGSSRRRRKPPGRRTSSQTAAPSSSWSLRWPPSLTS